MKNYVRISVQPTIDVNEHDSKLCGVFCRFLEGRSMSCSLFMRDLKLTANGKPARCKRCKMAENKCNKIFGKGCVKGMLPVRWKSPC